MKRSQEWKNGRTKNKREFSKLNIKVVVLSPTISIHVPACTHKLFVILLSICLLLVYFIGKALKLHVEEFFPPRQWVPMMLHPNHISS